MDEYDPIERAKEPSNARIYRRKGAGPTIMTAVGVRRPLAQGEDDWDKLKSNWNSKPGDKEELVLLKQTSLAKPAVPRRSLSEGQPSTSKTAVMEKDVFDFDDFDSLSISKTAMNLVGKPVADTVKHSNPYDFDQETDLPRSSQSSSGSSSYPSSQESNKSTGSLKRVSPNSLDDEVVFRKPLQPAGKSKTAPVPVTKGDSFPPSRKRPAPKGGVEARPKKISPDKIPNQSQDPVPSSSRGPTSASSSNPKPVVKAVIQPVRKPVENHPAPIQDESDAGRISTETVGDQQFADVESEIDYLLNNLDLRKNSPMVRCSTAIKLSRKLLDPTFRVHFFTLAHGRIFDLLKDAARDANLRLCAAVIVLVMSTDSLKMNIDQNGMELLSDIVKRDDEKSEKVDPQIMNGVAAVVATSKFKDDLERNKITTTRLVLEALMRMKLGSQWPWFMDEIRHQGFLDHLIKHLRILLPELEARMTLSNINALTRLMDFFFKISHRSKENSEYLVSGCRSAGLKALVQLGKFCNKQLLSKKTPGDIKAALASLLQLVFLVMANASFHAELWRDKMGSETSLLELSVNCCISLAPVTTREKYQEILLQAVPCLVNLTHNCESNCQRFVDIVPANAEGKDKITSVSGFVRLAKNTHEAAESSGDDLERCTDRLINKMDTTAVYTDLMEKAGENLEQFSIMSYIGILLSHLITYNEVARSSLHEELKATFGTVSTGTEILTGAIRSVADMLANVVNHDGNNLPVHDMHTAIDILEAYGLNHKPS
ncbi:wings apart-like protein homolog [Paramacrobiotus metropolitanus]|uniref:wings apart-like protein homolog n=1 Tax=Paramacrobiotus metropolitanus TaxID=2943436 RepID=UPI0024456AA6|nr:wings apart-like protein homolog [Paramacrobiotus metropolitanus]